MKKYGFAAGVIMGLYTLNRFVLLPRAHGLLPRLLSGYFADFLEGGMMVVLLFAVLHLAHRKPPRLWHCLALALVCGLFWEYITPLYLPRSVSDPWDILAVLLGGGCILPGLYHLEK